MERGEEREGKEEEEEEETFSPGREETDPNEHFPSDIFFLKKAHCCNTPGMTRIPLVIKPIPLIYLHMAPPEKSVLTATRDTHPIPQPFVRRRTPFGRVLCVNAWLL